MPISVVSYHTDDDCVTIFSVYDETAIPIIMVGTKFDLVPDSKRANVVARSKYKADEVGCSEIHLVRSF